MPDAVKSIEVMGTEQNQKIFEPIRRLAGSKIHFITSFFSKNSSKTNFDSLIESLQTSLISKHIQ